MKILILTGKQGPAFGDRPSATVLTANESEYRVTNWPADDRADALRAAFDLLHEPWDECSLCALESADGDFVCPIHPYPENQE